MEKWDSGGGRRGEAGSDGVRRGVEGGWMHGWLVVMYSRLKSISMQGWTEIHRPEDGERRRGRTKSESEGERKRGNTVNK